MATHPMKNSPPEPTVNLISQARNLVKKLTWLSPVNTLDSYSGRDFGRSIESSIIGLTKDRQAKLIRLRKQEAAIVMPVNQYEEMVHLKHLYLALLEQVKEKAVAEAGDEFDQLFQQISSPNSRKAADLLFTATSKAFSDAYKPGNTEQT